MSNGIGRVWAVNAEGGDEGRPNGVGPVWIENADQLGSKLPEPESGDAGKVLGVLNSDGDIGWVIDQSGTFTQVQADWDQSDSSQVSYIANKPNLATVATSGAYSDLSGKPTIPTVDQVYDATSANAQSGVAVAGAISGKQDTINDLETIRSGAAAGATAVQPAALNDYATTSALTSGLSTKQDTINDLETIRSGAAAGATAVQPSSLATVATTGSYDDLLDKPTIPPGVVVDQVYDAASTNAQSGTAVAGAISGVRQVPSTSSGDNGKVLGVTDSAGTLGWVTKGEVDLFYVTYNVTTFDEIKTAHDAGKWPVLVDSSGHFVPMVDFDWIGTASSAQYAKFQTSTYLFHADTDGAGYYNVVYYLKLEIDPDMNRTETWYTASGDASADWNAVSGPRVIRNKPTIPTVDQSYNAASTNAQSGTAVTGAIATVRQLPTINSWEGDRYLKSYYDSSTGTSGANWTNLVASYIIDAGSITDNDMEYLRLHKSEMPIFLRIALTPTGYQYAERFRFAPLVDAETYMGPEDTIAYFACIENDTLYSYKVQKVDNVYVTTPTVTQVPSGGSTYTAGDGIDIAAGEISVKAGTGLEIGTSSGLVTAQTIGLTQHITSGGGYDAVNVIQVLTPEIFAAIGNNTASITLSTIPVDDEDFINWRISGGEGQTAYVVIGKRAERTSPNTGWSIDTTKAMYLGVAVQSMDASYAVPTNVAYNVHASDNTDSDSTLTWSELTTALAGGTISDYAIFIARKATSPSTGTIYPTAAMSSHITGVVDGTVTTGSITYTATVANALKVSNPIQLVAALPANPDANTLYLIPEA